jgi:Fe-S-cluster formation regulator IscX/YfhJ
MYEDKLKRMIAMGGEVESDPQDVKILNLPDIVAELRSMAEAQQRSQQIMYEALQNIVAAIEEKRLQSVDLQPLVEAVKSMSVTKGNNLYCDYQFSGERDPRTGLIKLDTLRFTAVPREVH